MSVIALPQAISAVAAEGSFRLVRQQAALPTANGVDQITSHPDRRWRARVMVKPRSGANLRAWSLFVTQMSDLDNVFALGPPHYDGPSTAYAGAAPLVNGADQLGLSFVCDGVTPSAAILLAGDFLSVDSTSAGSNTNRQLIQVTADATADGSGNVTFSLATPLHTAPANNATVNIATPTGFFRFEVPEALVDLDTNLVSRFDMDVIERIFP